MIGPGTPGETFTFYADNFVQGLAGTMTARVEDADGNIVQAPTTAGITEVSSAGGFAIYSYVGLYPSTLGTLVVIMSDGTREAAEDLLVDPDPSTVADGLTDGPCDPWINGEDLAAACGAAAGSTDLETYAGAAEGASSVLFELSGRIYTGICADTVRPASPSCSCWNGPGQWWWTDGYWSDGMGGRCGCQPMSRVKLAGTAREIISVKIDGTVVADSLYRLDSHKWLTRLADVDGTRAAWPGCQRLDLADTEEGTFSVRYFHGLEPPAAAVAAANQLGCEMFRAGQGQACKLPQGTVNVTKQGLSIDLNTLSLFLREGQTGLPLVDLFLKTANPTGRQRRSALWSPDSQAFARRLG